ncbi:unnamed protein product [Moneuplotes crassus]|uniref:Uncharacterized protein n=1 Tax=Euplotes crassus TaxID=5936 RepID=A0AAD1XIJ0_EUPCR|nr:unnamed protein product [Moneuplotes crassus]
MLKFNRKYVDKKHLKHKKNCLSRCSKSTLIQFQLKSLMVRSVRCCRCSHEGVLMEVRCVQAPLSKELRILCNRGTTLSATLQTVQARDSNTLLFKITHHCLRSMKCLRKEGISVILKMMADRTISIRKKFSQKKASIKAMSNKNSLNNSPAKKKMGDSNHRNEVTMKNFSKIMKASNPAEIFDKIRKRKKHERYLEEMNNCIFGRFAKRNIQNQVKSQPEDLSGPSSKFISRTFGLLQN